MMLSMISTVGVPHMVGCFVCFFIWNTIYGTKCMKRRCFDLNVIFTDVATTTQFSMTLVAFHPTCLHYLSDSDVVLTPLWTDDCTVSIELENTFCK